MSINNLKARIGYNGGQRQVDRMILDKQKSLKDSLWRAYQSATAVLNDGREFRCLINPNKISMEADDKILSIPFNDICLTSQEKEDTAITKGSVIQWKENGTYWIVYSQYLQEVAYFKGSIRQCSNEPITIGEQQYWFYLKGPNDQSIDWQKTKHLIFNNLNYSVELYITKDEKTLQFFQQFKKCKIHGKDFEVQAVDTISIDGILLVYLKESYVSAPDAEPVPDPEPEINPNDAYILGDFKVYPYETKLYTYANLIGGKWMVSNNRAKVVAQDQNTVTVEIVTGKSGSVNLAYVINNTVYFSQELTILSL